MNTKIAFRFVAIAFAGLALLIGLGSNNAAAQEICGNSSTGLLGNNNQYMFMGDQWNPNYSYVNQCIDITNSTTPPPTSLSGAGAGPSTNYVSGTFDNTSNTPSDYPDFLYGMFYGNVTQNTQLPMAVTNITGNNPKYNVLSGENVVEPSGYNNDMAYDIWFNTYAGTPSNANTTGTELMIWVQHNGSAGPISGGPSYSFTDSTGQSWTAYTGYNGGNCGCSGVGSQVISFVRNGSDGPTNAGGYTSALNLDDFFTEALKVGQIQSSWYLTAVEFGTEIWVGGPGLQVNNFFVNIVPNTGGGGVTTSGPVSINAGGGATGSYVADADFSGGNAASTTAGINTSNVANPAPQAVYQTERWGPSTYTMPGLTPGASYDVTLQFAEIYWTAAGQRQFNVIINGVQVLTDYDIFAAAGGENIAVAQTFTTTANSSGQVVVQFIVGAADQPKISGIEVAASSGGGGGSGGGNGIVAGAWYNIINQHSGSCVDDTGWGTSNGTFVQQYTCGNQQYNQEWQFIPTSNGYYSVINRNAAAENEVWDVTGGPGATTPGTPIQTWSNGQGTNQQWKPVAMGNGYYTFQVLNSGMCLDTPGDQTTNGLQLDAYTCNGTAAQSFTLSQQP